MTFFSRLKILPGDDILHQVEFFGKMIRPLFELAGIHDVLTKAHGSTTAKNLLKAGMNALQRLRTAESVGKLRGVPIT